MEQNFRRIPTKRGVYFVAWRPEDVAGLIINERLSPTDLLSAKPSEIHHFIRDLYLLACRSALNSPGNPPKTALLARYARELRSSLKTTH